MRFITPLAFLGFLSLPVIIGLHLHMARNRRMVVSSIYLWSFLEDKFEGEKPKYIQLSWLLLLDLLIASLLSLAFAQPVVSLPSLGGEGVQRVILIDDSTSMHTQDGNPDRFTIAKEIALDFIKGARRQDETTVITFGGSAELIGSTLFMSQEKLSQTVNDLQVLGSGVDLRGGLALALSEAAADLPIEVYILTDAAYDLIDLDDFSIQIHWIFIGFEQNNQAIIGPVLESKDTKTELFFNVVNFGSIQNERDLEIRINQQLVQTQKVLLSPNSVNPKVVSISGDIETVEVQLLGQDFLPDDDIAVLSNVSSPIVKVALVTETPEPIDRAIAAVPGVELKIFAPFEYTTNLEFDLVIFRGFIPEKWPSGKVLVFDPPSGNSRYVLDSLEPITEPVQVLSHEILKNVNLTGVRWEYVWRLMEGLDGEELVWSGNLPLLVDHLEDQSEVFFFLAPLSSGNFTKHPAFPLFLSSLIKYSEGFSPLPEYQLGDVLDLNDVFETYAISILTPRVEESQEVLTREISLDTTGLYSLEMTNQNGEKIQMQFGVNAGGFQESNILPGEWRLQYAEAEQTMPQGFQVVEVNLSPWLLLVVAILLLVEAWRAWR
ncbi:MAG: BatA and WFA domain-containing protein [Anaerolineales bacterium]